MFVYLWCMISMRVSKKLANMIQLQFTTDNLRFYVLGYFDTLEEAKAEMHKKFGAFMYRIVQGKKVLFFA